MSPGVSPRHKIGGAGSPRIVRLPQRTNALDGVVIADGLEHFPDAHSGRDSVCRSVTPTPRGSRSNCVSPFLHKRKQGQRRPTAMESADVYVSADRFVHPRPGAHGEVWGMAMTDDGMLATIAPLTGHAVTLML